MDILNRIKDESLKPSSQLMKKLESYHLDNILKFKENVHNVPQSKIDDFHQYSRNYQGWKFEMGFGKMKTKEILASLSENPWAQLREEQSVGVEPLKNQKTRKLWKRGHVLQKFTDSKLDDEGGLVVGKLPKQLV